MTKQKTDQNILLLRGNAYVDYMSGIRFFQSFYYDLWRFWGNCVTSVEEKIKYSSNCAENVQAVWCFCSRLA